MKIGFKNPQSAKEKEKTKTHTHKKTELSRV